MTTPTQPAYKPGDAVFYYDTGEKGHVSKVNTVTSYTYDVQWDDPDEGNLTGTYPEEYLKAKP